jgi:uncharacterized protein YjbJ (UPF0337 family)
MNEDRVIGNAKNVGGQVEEGFGRATGDVKSQLQGKAKQMEGAVRPSCGLRQLCGHRHRGNERAPL